MEIQGIDKKIIRFILERKLVSLKKYIIMQNQSSYLKQIGGKETLKRLVPILYENVLNDESLKKFFKGLDMKR